MPKKNARPESFDAHQANTRSHKMNEFVDMGALRRGMHALRCLNDDCRYEIASIQLHPEATSPGHITHGFLSCCCRLIAIEIDEGDGRQRPVARSLENSILPLSVMPFPMLNYVRLDSLTKDCIISMSRDSNWILTLTPSGRSNFCFRDPCRHSANTLVIKAYPSASASACSSSLCHGTTT